MLDIGAALSVLFTLMIAETPEETAERMADFKATADIPEDIDGGSD